jgi:hypothetical protein
LKRIDFQSDLKHEEIKTTSEVFPSVEDALRNKRSSKSAETFNVACWTAVGAASVIGGLEHIVSGAQSKNLNDVVDGINYFILGLFFLNCAGNAVEARELAKRQLERLNGTVSRIKGNKEHFTPHE